MNRDATIQGICQCGNKQSLVGKKKDGRKVYRILCEKCHRFGQRIKKSSCENCGFIALHSCQLDVDHIDGNKRNHDESNLQTLCANCHRLKTHANNEWNNEYGI